MYSGHLIVTRKLFKLYVLKRAYSNSIPHKKASLFLSIFQLLRRVLANVSP